MSDAIFKQGWLHKRGLSLFFTICKSLKLYIKKRIGEHIKTWRSRYFILRNDCNFLGYNNRPFTKDELETPNNTFYIKGL